MTCTSPFNLDTGQRVPCGRCLACRIAYSREWGLRIMHEMDAWKTSSFITLTYAPKNLPDGGSLDKPEFQKFMKRLRKRIPGKMKYFACGEYGESYGRPHYHIAAFGVGPKEKEEVELSWKKGFVHMGTLTYNSAVYVAGYIMKKYNGEKARQVYGEKQVPFKMCSKGIGADWLDKNKDPVLQDLFVTMHGSKMSLPRYYKKLLGEEIEIEKLIARDAERAAEHEKRLVKRGVDVWHEVEYEKAQRDQRDLELRQKLERRRKGKL